jgi:asparagine synthase (glutamine-hydrolysing)
MCGFVGFFNPLGLDVTTSHNDVMFMSDLLAHRGPDDEGSWLDADVGIAFSHRRLAVVDLSQAGHQPMHSACGRYVIAFNGEIYNHLALRAELEKVHAAPVWLGHSDTETLLATLSHWGIEAGLQRLVGMFAFALWDKQTRKLTLARDRLGEKPLYYGWQNDTFLFGSELKALAAHPDFCSKIDRRVLPLYFRHGYIPAPHSIYAGIFKLEPGHFLTLSGTPDKTLQAQAYWSLISVAKNAIANPFTGSTADAVDGLGVLLSQAVSGQMMADVPMGAFLSGGVDSSTVVALMQSLATRPIKTFTIGFTEQGYNEAEQAKAVARYLGTDHTELYVSPAEALGVIPLLPALYDEPFADSSQIPTFLVSRLARQQVTVSLSGDGGDELFGGYSRYSRAGIAHGRLNALPKVLRGGIAGLLTMLPAVKSGRFDRRRALLIAALRAQTGADFYRQFVSHWLDSDCITVSGEEAAYILSDSSQQVCFDDFFDTAMLSDSLSYLPDDILVKVDRAAMGVSLETRVPLLDHRVVEWAWRLPQSLKSQHGQAKWVLRELLYRYVPNTLIDRPKMGFGVPIAQWLRGPLRDWAEDLLDPVRMKNEDLLNPEPIQYKWREHLAGKGDWSYHLWDVLMFQAWLRQHIHSPGVIL